MDIVNDLTSQAVSFLTIIQDLIKKDTDFKEEMKTSAFFYSQANEIGKMEEVCNDYHKERISAIIWMSRGKELSNLSVKCFFKSSSALIKWLQRVEQQLGYTLGTLYSSPYEWRRGIKFVLYELPDERLELVKILQYLPMQVILCLGGGKLEVYDQRLLQVWDQDLLNDKDDPKQQVCTLNLVSEDDSDTFTKWWGGTYQEKARIEHAMQLLKDYEELLKTLKLEKIPLPFDTLLHDELNEIQLSRKIRLMEPVTEKQKEYEECIFRENELEREAGVCAYYGENDYGEHKAVSIYHSQRDPIDRAKAMGLYGLAFSGGGIRSATFNLGILQKLAEANLLKKFDYLSTVSGGGYIGTWFESWVSRTGSITKVNDRLNPVKSADPLADEVRPIRWLRMFSNYLSPNASIMSVDAWTMGVTWLRNTLINQVILLLIFCALLSLLTSVYNFWNYVSPKIHLYNTYVAAGSIIIFILASLLAGWGMQVYSPQQKPKSPFSRDDNGKLAMWLMLSGLVFSVIISAWLYTEKVPVFDIHNRGLMLWSAGVGFAGLLIIVILGRYDKCALPGTGKFKIYFMIIISSAVAVSVGIVLLELCRQILVPLRDTGRISNEFPSKLAFMLGVPLILEVISIVVVIRMAIMGNLFPDERREWWGRLGAMAHLFIFFWILISFAVLLLPNLYTKYLPCIQLKWLITTLGGWGAIVGTAVKMAFGSKTSGEKDTKNKSAYTELFVSIAPYIFFAGVLIISSYVLHFISLSVAKSFSINNREILLSFLIFTVLGGIASLISLRVGVNEFSLHYFYRNRLVRAYLGATRPRIDRQKTVNNFTDFDSRDDMKLANLVTDVKTPGINNYTGPYPIINTTLNASVVTEGDLDRQDRKGESFIFTPKYCGFDFSHTRPASGSAKKSYDYGYRPTSEYGYPGGPNLGTAMAISGAAVNPNMGYHTSPIIAFLLTVFNVRLGWWMGNPRKSKWTKSDPKFGLSYLIYDLIGDTSTKSNFVCLSDGGHFDDLGVYELVRRRCKYILVCDAGQDTNTTCEDFANSIRRCRIDFGVQIEMNNSEFSAIVTKDDKKFAKGHNAKGSIWYPGDPDGKPSGRIRYVKTSVSLDQSVDLREYFMDNDEFPQQSTADQFFDEAQFESYRKLGYSSL